MSFLAANCRAGAFGSKVGWATPTAPSKQKPHRSLKSLAPFHPKPKNKRPDALTWMNRQAHPAPHRFSSFRPFVFS
jgi:hypothetical protein